MLLIDTGAIAEMKRKMAAAGAPPSPIQPMPQAPIQPPPLLAPPPEVQLPLVQEPPPITGGLGPKVTKRDSLMARINDLGRAEVPADLAPFLSQSEQMKATEGSLLGRIGTQALGLGLFTPSVVARAKAGQMIAAKDELAKRNDAATLKEQMAALRQKYANGGGDFRQFAAELAMLRPELSAQLAGMVNAMEERNVQPRNIDPLSTQGIAAQKELLAAKPQPNNDLTPYQRESLRLRELELRMRGMAQPAGAKAPRPPTEAQEKSHIFYNLMANSAPEIDALVAKGTIRPDMVTLALRSGVLDFATNRMLNDDEQKLIRAARDFTAGVLRKESGAAIKNDEILNTFQRMIPLSGEGAPVTESKRKAREQYMKTMEQSALPARNYYKAIEGGVPLMDPDFPDAQGGIAPVAPAGGGKTFVHNGKTYRIP